MMLIAISNGLIAVSYFSISLFLIVFVIKRKDIPFPKVFILFGAFILACGTTHLMHVIGLWLPVDGWQAAVDTVTALISVMSAILLWPLLPRFLAIPGPEQLRVLNRELQKGKTTLEHTQDELRKAYADVEQRVIERTADLGRANESLQAEIRERTRAEEALRKSENLFHVIFEHANDAIHIDNADDQIIQVNQRMCELMGYSRNELLNMCIADLQAPEVRGHSGKVIYSELGLHGNNAFEGLNLHSSGRRIPVEISVSRVESSEGDLYISILRDITERKQTEAKLTDQLNELRRWYDATLGREGRVLELKQEVNELLAQTGRPPRYPSAEAENQ